MITRDGMRQAGTGPASSAPQLHDEIAAVETAHSTWWWCGNDELVTGGTGGVVTAKKDVLC